MNYGKYKLWIQLNCEKSEVVIDLSDEIEEIEWQKMTEKEQSDYLQDCLQDFINSYFESGWSEVDE